MRPMMRLTAAVVFSAACAVLAVGCSGSSAHRSSKTTTTAEGGARKPSTTTSVISDASGSVTVDDVCARSKKVVELERKGDAKAAASLAREILMEVQSPALVAELSKDPSTASRYQRCAADLAAAIAGR